MEFYNYESLSDFIYIKNRMIAKKTKPVIGL